MLKFIGQLFYGPKEIQFIFQFSNSPFISKLTREQAKSQYEMFTEIYERAIKEDLFKRTYIEFIPDYFEGIFNMAITHFRKHPERVSEENLDMAFEICWSGIAR